MSAGLNRAIATALPCLLIAGCMMGPQRSSAEPATDAPTEQTCHAEPAKAFIGKPFDAAALRKASGAGEVRRVKPGEMVSMLFMNGRLTVYVDAQGLITSLSCS